MNPSVEGEREPELVFGPEPEPEYPRQGQGHAADHEHGHLVRDVQFLDLVPMAPIPNPENALQNMINELNRRKIRAQELAENNPTFAPYQIYLASQQENPEDERRVMHMYYTQNHYVELLRMIQEIPAGDLSEGTESGCGNPRRHEQANIPPSVE